MGHVLAGLATSRAGLSFAGLGVALLLKRLHPLRALLRLVNRG